MAGEVRTKIVVDADTKKAVDGLEDVADAAVTAETKVDDLDGATVAVDTGTAVSDLADVNQATERAAAGVDELEAAGRRLASQSFDMKVDVDPTRIRDTGKAIDDVGKSADSSKSVLANMVGNSTQDLGALGGVAGSAGVAIGQMGEYIADAVAAGEGFGSVVKSFAGVAGPIAALSGAMLVLNKIQENNAKAAKVNTDSTERWTKALEAGGDAAIAYTDALAETGKVMLDLNHLTTKQNTELNRAEHSWHGLDGIINIFQGDTEDVADTMAAAGLTVEQLTRSVQAGANGQKLWTSAVEQSNVSDADKAKLLALLAQETDAYTKSQENAIRNQEIFNTGAASSTKSMDMIAESIALAKSNMDRFGADGVENMDSWRDATADAADEIDTLQRKYEGFMGILDRRTAIRNAETAFDDLKQAATDAFIAQASGAADAETKMRGYEQSIDDMIAALITAQAPPDIIAEVVARVDSGQVNEAIWIAQDWLNRHPVTLPVKPVIQKLPGGAWVDENGNVHFPRGGVTSAPAPAPAASGARVVNVHLPRTASARELTRELDRWAGLNA